MYVSKIENQPNFGLTYINKKSWNRNILKTLERSNLVKEIDGKYPTAFASYIKVKETKAKEVEPNYHISFILKLAKDKIWNFNIDSRTSEGVDRALLKVLKQKKLSDVERESVPVIKSLRGGFDEKPENEHGLLKKLWKSIFK